MKNPNQYGSITRLSGVRRRPYWIREGKSGQQKTIGYAATKEEALKILAEFNHMPWAPETRDFTFKEIFDAYMGTCRLGKASIAALNYAFRRLEQFHDTAYISLKPQTVQRFMDSLKCSPSAKGAIRNIFYHLDSYTLENEMGIPPKSPLITVVDNGDYEHKEKTVFTDEEIEALWESRSELGDCMLVLLYTGFRLNEAMSLTPESYDPVEKTLKGGSKTKAGKNRIVPVHHRIQPIVEMMVERMAEGRGSQFFILGGKAISAHAFWSRMENNYKHSPHECRHTFRSRLDSANANRVTIDRLMGHASMNVGERVYTHKNLSELREAIELLK